MAEAGQDGAMLANRDARRARLFSGLCLGMMAVLPIFYGIGLLQGGWRAWLVIGMTTLLELVLLGARWMVARGQLSAAVHLVGAIACALFLGGMGFAGRVGPVASLFAAVVTLGIFHARPRDILITTAMTTGSLLIAGATLPALDPAQVPTLLGLQVVIGLVVYFAAQGIEADIDDLRQTNVALEAARAQADAANHAKSVFLATMSHELRTPLNAVIGYAEMQRQAAEDDELDPREAARDLARIEGAGRQLLGLVSSVLDVARVESGQLQLAVEPVGIRALLDELAAGTAPRAGVQVQVQDGLPPGSAVRTDRAVVAQILRQLLANAVRFTQQGALTLGAAPAEGGGVRLDIIDTGIGIAPQDQERIFDVFTQLDGSYTRTVGGAGLGLSLCRRLAARLGGTLAVSSALGQGATFSLTLPPAPPDA